MVHQPSAGFQGQATDIQIHAKEIMSLKERLNNIYSKHTEKSVSEIPKLWKEITWLRRGQKIVLITLLWKRENKVPDIENSNFIDKNITHYI